MAKKFTDEEFEAVDPFYSLRQVIQDSDDKAWLNMNDIQFATNHSHENESIMLTQRFVQSTVTPEGFSEESPHQVSIVIPLDTLQEIIIDLMSDAACLVIAKKEGYSSHEAE